MRTDDTLQNPIVGSMEIEGSSTSSDEEGSFNDEGTWKMVWSRHLLAIQSVVKELPDNYSAPNSTDTLKTSEGISDNENTISMPNGKSKYLRDISNRKRLYLTDINDFERSWELLFSIFHPLQYKLMLFVSVIIAFGLDLISFSMGCLLFKIKIKM